MRWSFCVDTAVSSNFHPVEISTEAHVDQLSCLLQVLPA